VSENVHTLTPVKANVALNVRASTIEGNPLAATIMTSADSIRCMSSSRTLFDGWLGHN
jgi:hypothetical protein